MIALDLTARRSPRNSTARLLGPVRATPSRLCPPPQRAINYSRAWPTWTAAV